MFRIQGPNWVWEGDDPKLARQMIELADPSAGPPPIKSVEFTWEPALLTSPKIRLIKALREVTDLSLAEAKEAIERGYLREQMPEENALVLGTKIQSALSLIVQTKIF